MAVELEDKIVVVTGGADGIGLEIADNYLKEGAKLIIILDIQEGNGKEAVKKLTQKYGDSKAVFIKCDVTKDLDTISEEIFHTYKNVDLLVNNAGILNEHNIRKTIEINVIAVMEWTMKFREHMRTDKGGKGGTIINLASIYGYRTDQYGPFYNASKFAVMGFTKSLGHEYNFNKSGVRVVAVCPGYTHTKLTDSLTESDFPDQKFWDFKEFLDSPSALWQNVDAVGKAAVEVFKRAKSGTAWLIEGGKPIEEIP